MSVRILVARLRVVSIVLMCPLQLRWKERIGGHYTPQQFEAKQGSLSRGAYAIGDRARCRKAGIPAWLFILLLWRSFAAASEMHDEASRNARAIGVPARRVQAN